MSTAAKQADRPRTPATTMRSSSQRLLELALAWFKLRERRRAYEKSAERLKKGEAEIRDRMIQAGLRAGETIIGRTIRMKRELRDGQVAFRLADARKQGALTPEMEKALAPFITRGDPYEVWDGRLLPAVLPEDDADSAP